MLSNKTPTIMDVENGKEVVYNKLIEGTYVEGSTKYHPMSGLWECKNGEVVAVVESIKQGKRVLAQPHHYHSNRGMCVASGTVPNTETGETVDLIDSMLASGGSGQIDGVPYIFKKFLTGEVINMTPTCILECGVHGNVDFNSYRLKLQATTPRFTSEKFHVKFKESAKGIYFLIYGLNVNYNDYKLLIGTKEVNGETEYYYLIRDTISVDGIWKDVIILKSVLYSKNAISDGKIIRVLYESENGFNNYVLKNDEEQCYDFYVAQNGSFKKVAKVGYYEYTDTSFLGAFGDLRSKYPEEGAFFVDVANFFEIEYIPNRPVEEDIYVPPTYFTLASEMNRMATEDYELMNNETKPTLLQKAKMKFKSFFKIK